MTAMLLPPSSSLGIATLNRCDRRQITQQILPRSLEKEAHSSMTGLTPDDSHCTQVIRAIEMGRLIAFFGAGVNLCNRPKEYDWKQRWDPGSAFLPPEGLRPAESVDRHHQLRRPDGAGA